MMSMSMMFLTEIVLINSESLDYLLSACSLKI